LPKPLGWMNNSFPSKPQTCIDFMVNEVLLLKD